VAKAGSKHTAGRGSRGPLRPADFPPPKRISDEKFLEACEGFDIPDHVREFAKTYLHRLVDDFRDWMKEEERRDRRNDLNRIEKAQRRIFAALHQLQGLERDGRDALRVSGSEPLARMLSADWVTQHFPRDAPSKPERIAIASSERPLVRQSARDSTSKYEGLKHQFIRYRAPEAFKAVLRDIETGLASTVRSLRLRSPPGGRPTLRYRHDLIFNLADFWHRIGKKVVGTPKSNFVAFCHYIFEAMGWPTDGLDAAIPDAINDWRNRR
jgi:hypothetical protein